MSIARINWSDPINWAHPLNRSLVGRWKVTPNAWGGSTLRNLTGLHHGTLDSMDLATDWRAPTRRGGFGELSYDSVDAFVDLGDIAALNFNGPFSVAAWIKIGANPDSDNTSYRVVQKRGTGGFGSQAGWQFAVVRIDSSTPGSYKIGNTGVDDGTDSFILSSGTPQGIATIAEEEWTHIAMTWNGSAIGTSYVNGVFDATFVRETGAGDVGDMSNARNATIGCAWQTTQSQFFDGLIDDTVIWDRVLSANEVAEDYEIGLRGSLDLYNLFSTRVFSIPAAGGVANPWYQYQQQLIGAA